MFRSFRIAILTLLVASGGCFGPANTPGGIVEVYVEAAISGDQEGMRTALSKTAVGAFARKPDGPSIEEALAECAGRFSKVESFEVTGVEDKGSYTKVFVAFTLTDGSTRSVTWPVRKYDGQWHLDELRGPG